MKFFVWNKKHTHNTADCFAVAIVKDETVVGHVPREVHALFGTSSSMMELQPVK